MWYVIQHVTENQYWVDPISAVSQKDNMGSYWDSDVKKAYRFQSRFSAETAIAAHGLTNVVVKRVY